jgi:hypothetical protein
MVIEMLLNNDIQKNCSNDFRLSKGNKCHYIHYGGKKKKTLIISFGQNLIRYEFSKFMFL